MPYILLHNFILVHLIRLRPIVNAVVCAKREGMRVEEGGEGWGGGWGGGGGELKGGRGEEREG